MRNMQQGAGGIEQAVDRLMNQIIRNQMALANRMVRIGPKARQAADAARQVQDLLGNNQEGALQNGEFP
jgi:hypothetical protein